MVKDLLSHIADDKVRVDMGLNGGHLVEWLVMYYQGLWIGVVVVIQAEEAARRASKMNETVVELRVREPLE